MEMLASLGITKDLLADMIINIGSIIVLFLIVKKLAYKPIKKFMDERTQRIQKAEESAEALSNEAKLKEDKYNLLLDECEQAKAKATKDGEKTALEESKKIISNAKEKARQIINNAEEKAEEKYKKAVNEADSYIVNLAVEMSSKLLNREVNDDDNQKIVESFLSSLDGDKNA